MRLLLCIILANIQMGFTGQNHWYMHSFGYLLLSTILSYMVYEKVSFENCIKKTSSFLAFIYFALCALHGALMYSDIMKIEHELLITYTAVLAVLAITNIYKNLTYKSDKLGLDYVYILNRKPFCNICILPTLMFNEHGSCAIYCGGYVYGFKKGQNFKRFTQKEAKVYLKASRYTQTSCHTLKGKEILRRLNGRKWKFSFNCFSVANMFK